MEGERLASVYIRSNDYLVEANSKVETGFWVSTNPVIRLSRSASVTDLGTAVRLALAESRRGGSYPSLGGAFPSSLLEVAGVRSWNDLQRSAALCLVKGDSSIIRVVPHRNGGTTGDDKGYHSLSESSVDVAADASDDELGAAVRAAMSACC
jgi:hypothetical protein